MYVNISFYSLPLVDRNIVWRSLLMPLLRFLLCILMLYSNQYLFKIILTIIMAFKIIFSNKCIAKYLEKYFLLYFLCTFFYFSFSFFVLLFSHTKISMPGLFFSNIFNCWSFTELPYKCILLAVMAEDGGLKAEQISWICWMDRLLFFNPSERNVFIYLTMRCCLATKEWYMSQRACLIIRRYTVVEAYVICITFVARYGNALTLNQGM